MVDTGSNLNIHYLQIFLSLIFFFVCQLIACIFIHTDQILYHLYLSFKQSEMHLIDSKT